MRSNPKNNTREVLRNIPSVDEILSEFHLDIPINFFKLHVNKILSNIRKDILDGKKIKNIREYTMDKINKEYNIFSKNSLRSVINGTGIILHTGLGRAPISKEILIDGIEKNYPYSNLEIDINSGKRGDRNSHLNELFQALCNCESSLMVNNNASAVFLMLNAICEKKEVIISRGQQVEIGGSFRIPDIISKSQCKMVEVGTTNKTHLKDYEDAITSDTAAILYVHTSNYKVIGFTNEIDISKLALLAEKYSIPLMIDLGSGSLADFKSFGLPMEKMVEKYIEYGADIITFSGDKLLGGPQAGIIIGKKIYTDKIKSNPIYRTSRCDKLRISLMETILRTYYTSKKIGDTNLSIKLFLRSQDELIDIAKNIISKTSKTIIKSYNVKYIESNVEAGSGSLPTEKIPSISITFNNKNIKCSDLYQRFIHSSIPVIGYVNNDLFHIDLKAIPDDQISDLIHVINKVL